MLAAELQSPYPTPPALPDVSLEQLLHWPGIAMTVAFRDITYTRRISPNYKRDIIYGETMDINMDKSANTTETRRFTQISSIKPGSLISKKVFEEYLGAIEDAMRLIDVSKSRAAEMQLIFKIIKEDIAILPSLYLKSSFSRFANKQKFWRLFENDGHYRDTQRRMRACLRETVNPEIQFTVERCNFLYETLNYWEPELLKYFEALFIRHDSAALNNLKETFKKCISFTCLICNQSFDGVLCIYAIKAHLPKHFYDKNWDCVNCQSSFSQFDLTKVNWQHICPSANEAPLKAT